MLKEHVAQMIPILYEDHGKTIRVSTIVILFFLPLNVSSTSVTLVV